MRHYEIIIMIHPDHSNHVTDMIKSYSVIINNDQGQIHRLEDWGRRQLAYPINKLFKAHYVLFNIEVSKQLINKLEKIFKFDESIIRSMIIQVKSSITEPSNIFKAKEDNNKCYNTVISDKHGYKNSCEE